MGTEALTEAESCILTGSIPAHRRLQQRAGPRQGALEPSWEHAPDLPQAGPWSPHLVLRLRLASGLMKNFDNLTVPFPSHLVFLFVCSDYDLLVENKEGGICPVLFSGKGVQVSTIVLPHSSSHMPRALSTPLHRVLPLHPHTVHVHPCPMIDPKPYLPQEAFPDSQDAPVAYKPMRAETVVPIVWPVQA